MACILGYILASNSSLIVIEHSVL